MQGKSIIGIVDDGEFTYRELRDIVKYAKFQERQWGQNYHDVRQAEVYRLRCDKLSERIATLTAERDAAREARDEWQQQAQASMLRLTEVYGDVKNFVEWSETDKERYAQLSPPETFNLLRKAEAERDALRAQVAETLASHNRLSADLGTELAALRDENRTLRAQVAETWVPVGHLEYIECPDGSLKISAEMTGTYLFASGEDGDLIRRNAVVELPNDIRLCRRVPAAQPQPGEGGTP